LMLRVGRIRSLYVGRVPELLALSLRRVVRDLRRLLLGGDIAKRGVVLMIWVRLLGGATLAGRACGLIVGLRVVLRREGLAGVRGWGVCPWI